MSKIPGSMSNPTNNPTHIKIQELDMIIEKMQVPKFFLKEIFSSLHNTN
jgi:hypothetical protein